MSLGGKHIKQSLSQGDPKLPAMTQLWGSVEGRGWRVPRDGNGLMNSVLRGGETTVLWDRQQYGTQNTNGPKDEDWTH